jgi:aspartyl-tRNA(Asn)/glutamyl-tRNA(Gln) amidotransferase subunit C
MSSQLTPEAVTRIADLARLEISPEERDQFSRQLTAILEYAARVQQVDTSAVTPADRRGSPAIWREDLPAAGLTREDALAAAPDASREHGLFRVPKVI